MSLPARMRAAVLHGKEDLRVETVPLAPPAPGAMVVRLHSALTCGTDLKVWRRGYHAAMLKPPCRFGHEGAGIVAALGEGADSDTAPGLRIGEAVVVANSAPCGTCRPCSRGQENLCDDLHFLNGTYAEYLEVPPRFVRRNTWRVPPGLPLEHAALTEPLACVVHGLRETPVRRGDDAIVIGLGPIGLFWVALLRHAGANVSAVGRHSARLEAARALGASVLETPSGNYDLVVEATGRVETWNEALGLARKGGAVNLFGGPPAGSLASFDTTRLHYGQVTLKSPFHHRPDTIREALDLVHRGVVPGGTFVTESCGLEDLPALFREMAGSKRGVKTRIATAGAP